jgi:hypothetical protein
MAKNTVKAEASTTPSSKADVVEVTNFDKTTKVTEVKRPSGETPGVKGQQPKPSTQMAPVLTAEDRQLLRRVGAKMLTSAQIEGSVSISCPNNKTVELALQHGAQGLVDEFAPADAVEATYAPVIVGIRNAVMTALHMATRGSDEQRDVELNMAFKGAGVLVQLLEAFDSHRGSGNRRVTVGSVNVEPGAQAIVGNVQTTPQPEPTIKDSTIDPKRKPRAA